MLALIAFRVANSLHTYHILTLIILLTNLILFDVVTYRWSIQTTWLPLYIDHVTVFLAEPSASLDNTALEICQTSYSTVASIDTSWNISTLTNTASLNFFSLLSVNDLFCNLYNLASTYAEVALIIELPLIPVLNAML